MRGMGMTYALAVGTYFEANATPSTTAQAPAKGQGRKPFRQAGKEAINFATNVAKKGYDKLKRLFFDSEQQVKTDREQELERLASVFDDEPKSEVTEAEEMLGRESFDQIVANAILDEENN